MSGGVHDGHRGGSSRHVAHERVRTGLFRWVSVNDDGRDLRGGGLVSESQYGTAHCKALVAYLASVACRGMDLMRDSHPGRGPSLERARAGETAGRNRRRP